MDKTDVIHFFDNLAAHWDETLLHNDVVIGKILDNAQITAGVDVLDVACGTGVLMPDYLSRQVGSVTGIDISPKMIDVAQKKFPQVQFLTGDVETTQFDRLFDRIVVYNAFPHFPDPENLIRVLAGNLKQGGILTIAHGLGRAAIDSHHSGSAHSVSMGLMHEDELEQLLLPLFNVTVKRSDASMYQLVGVKQ